MLFLLYTWFLLYKRSSGRESYKYWTFFEIGAFKRRSKNRNLQTHLQSHPSQLREQQHNQRWFELQQFSFAFALPFRKVSHYRYLHYFHPISLVQVIYNWSPSIHLTKFKSVNFIMNLWYRFICFLSSETFSISTKDMLYPD